MKNIILCTKNKEMYDEFLEKIKSIDDEIKIVHVNKVLKIMNVSRSFCPGMVIIDGESFVDYKNIPKDLSSISSDKVFVIVHPTLTKKNNKKGLQSGYNLALNDLSSYGNLLAIKNNIANIAAEKLKKEEVVNETINKEETLGEKAHNDEIHKEEAHKEEISVELVKKEKAIKPKEMRNEADDLEMVENKELVSTGHIHKEKQETPSPKNHNLVDQVSKNDLIIEEKEEIMPIKSDLKKSNSLIEDELILESVSEIVEAPDEEKLIHKLTKDPIIEEVAVVNTNPEPEILKSEEVHNIQAEKNKAMDEIKAIEDSFLEFESLIAPIIKNAPNESSLLKQSAVEDYKKEALLDVEKSITDLFSSIKDIGIPLGDDLTSILDSGNTLKSIINKRNKREDRGVSYEAILDDLKLKKTESIPPKIFIQPEPKRYMPHWKKDVILTLFRIDKLKIKGFTQETIPKALRKIHDEEKRRFEKLKSINEAAVKTFDLSVSRIMIEPKVAKTNDVKLFNDTPATKSQISEVVPKKAELLTPSGINFEEETIPEEVFVKDTLNNIKDSISSYDKLSAEVQQKEKVAKFEKEEVRIEDDEEENTTQVFEIDEVLKSEASFKKLSEEWANKEKVVAFDETEKQVAEDEESEEAPAFEDSVIEKLSESSFNFNELNKTIREKEIINFEESERQAAKEEEVEEAPVFDDSILEKLSESSFNFNELNKTIREKDIMTFEETEKINIVQKEEKEGPLSANFEKELEESSRRSMLMTRANEKDKFSKDKRVVEDVTDLFSQDHENLPDQSVDEELFFKRNDEDEANAATLNDEQNDSFEDDILEDDNDNDNEVFTFPEALQDDEDDEPGIIQEEPAPYDDSDILKHPRFIKKEEESNGNSQEETTDNDNGFSFRRFQNDNKASKSNQSDLLNYNGTIEDIFGTKNSELTANQVSLMSKFNEKAKQKKREEVFAPKDFSAFRDEIVVEPPRHFSRVEEEVEPDKSKAKKKKKLFGFKK